ncbi:MAG: hypothetical protein KatS3mg068_2113 [Candidatus Sericytochromatia bacterium]|nr:MAG: hypothetical protein KatS3mg068_2113 [Candidatus Sericytochromatia bacterium]
MATKNDPVEEVLDEKSARALAIFFVTIFIIFSFILVSFYSSLRSKCIGLADGYIKAIETIYQSTDYTALKDFPEKNNFETGIYKVSVTLKKPKSIDEPIVIRVEIRDRFINIKHYSKEVKFVPIENEI